MSTKHYLTPLTENSRLFVPHNNGEFIFSGLPAGPGNYIIDGKRILSRDQLIPEAEELAFLVHASYFNLRGRYHLKLELVRDAMRKGMLWIYNRNLIDADGIYVVQDPGAIGIRERLCSFRRMFKHGKEISGVIFSSDKRVRFAPEGTYIEGEHTPESLALDGFIIASFGKIGAEKIAKASSLFKNNPIVKLPKLSERGRQRVSAVYTTYDEDRLIIDGSQLGDSGNGYSWGLMK